MRENLPEIHEVDLFLHFLNFLCIAKATNTIVPLLLIRLRTNRGLIRAITLRDMYLMLVY
jgi:hypothetical protein